MPRCDKHYQLVEQVNCLFFGEREFCQYLLTTDIYVHLLTSTEHLFYIYLQSSMHIYMTSADSVSVISYSTNLHLAIGLPDMYSDETMRIFSK